MPETLGQEQHQGEWQTLDFLREHGRRVGDKGFAKLRRIDLQEGKPIIIGDSIWVVFLYDRVRARFFLEHMYDTDNQNELFSAFKVLVEEWI